MQIRVIAGREFHDGDTTGGPDVAVVNEAFAQRFFPNRNPVGEHLAATVRGERKDLEIVGLVENTNAAGLRATPPPTVYVAYAQLVGDLPTTVTVRAAGPLGAMSAAMERALRSKLPGLPIEVRPLSAQVAATIVRERMMAALASGFGLLALTVACIGLYGLLAYTVAQRTREIGIRMALGAQRARVVAQILGGGTRLVAIGIALGLPAAWWASQWVESMLFGLTGTDPAVMGATVVALTIAGLLAAYLPARRASRVEPLTALRHE
jgi:ABC-type antimicrobial peptide transport system permease subunit